MLQGSLQGFLGHVAQVFAILTGLRTSQNIHLDTYMTQSHNLINLNQGQASESSGFRFWWPKFAFWNFVTLQMLTSQFLVCFTGPAGGAWSCSFAEGEGGGGGQAGGSAGQEGEGDPEEGDQEGETETQDYLQGLFPSKTICESQI